MFPGMRGTSDWITNARPENWRETILYLYPNGMAPLTALMSMMPSKVVDDPKFHWFTSTIGDVNGAVTNIFTIADFSVAYVTGGVVNDTLFVQITAAMANQVRVGHVVLLRDQSDFDVDVLAEVIDRVVNGANSYLAVKLLEADDNSANGDLSDCDWFKIVGNINAEGSEMPPAIARDPVEYDNVTQIFRTPLSITNTARATRLRTGDDYQKAKRECLEYHSIEMENAFMWGKYFNGFGDNGKPKRATRGLIDWIRTGAAANVDNYVTNATYAAQTWAAGGEIWFNIMLEQMFRYGSGHKLAFCGSGALLGIDAMAKAGGQINLSPGQTMYGMKVTEITTPFGELTLKTHPLFSFDQTTRNMMVIFEPDQLEYKFLKGRDTEFIADTNSRNSGTVDATIEEYLTEAGLEFHHPEKSGVLNGVGLLNTVAP